MEQECIGKKVVSRELTRNVLRSLDMARIKAVAYSELGACGSPGTLIAISDRADGVFVDEATAYDGETCYAEAADQALSFLRGFSGTSLSTTIRGSFVLPGTDWLHLNGGLGNHFFIRAGLFPEYMRRLRSNDFHARTEIVDAAADALASPSPNVKCMMGAVVGDVVGSRFEFSNLKSKDFELFHAPSDDGRKSKGRCSASCFTDDSVMTLALAEALAIAWRPERSGPQSSRQGRLRKLKLCAIESMRTFGRLFPGAGYGGRFRRWLNEERPQAYESWGNGAAMRVSACGWAAQSLEEAIELSDAVTQVTHNHPEEMKGAAVTAACVYLALAGKSMEEIRAYVEKTYRKLDFTLDEIRPTYEFDESCQGTVPQALEAFFESTSFEDAIRNAISIGGDSDTIGAITGAVAGAYYGIPRDIYEKAVSHLPASLLGAFCDFEYAHGKWRSLPEGKPQG